MCALLETMARICIYSIIICLIFNNYLSHNAILCIVEILSPPKNVGVDGVFLELIKFKKILSNASLLVPEAFNKDS